MHILLDTHILLWALTEPEKLSQNAQDMLANPSHEILYSEASIWEIAIKCQIKRVAFPIPPNEIAQAANHSGFTELPVHSRAAVLVSELPLFHRDPFDRLLVAQALTEPAHLLTVDTALQPYSQLVQLM